MEVGRGGAAGGGGGGGTGREAGHRLNPRATASLTSIDLRDLGRGGGPSTEAAAVSRPSKCGGWRTGGGETAGGRTYSRRLLRL